MNLHRVYAEGYKRPRERAHLLLCEHTMMMSLLGRSLVAVYGRVWGLFFALFGFLPEVSTAYQTLETKAALAREGELLFALEMQAVFN